MWARLLKDLRFESRRYLPAGSVVWLRRSGVIKRRDDGVYKQDCSTMTLEVRDAEFILVLPDESEGDLYVQCDEPAPGYEPEFKYLTPEKAKV